MTALQQRREWYATRCGHALDPHGSCCREKCHDGIHGDAMFEAGIQYARGRLRDQIGGWRGVDDFIAPFADAAAARAYWNGRLSALDAVLDLLGRES